MKTFNVTDKKLQTESRRTLEDFRPVRSIEDHS